MTNIEKVKLLHGDCLIESDNIESGSVDLILTDLPYGTMNGFNGINWDYAIDTKEIHKIATRILRKNGKMVLFSQEPYTTNLINNALPNLRFNYRAIWEKDNFANALLVNKAMVGMYEDILIFSKDTMDNDDNLVREYFKEQRELIKNISYKEINEKCFNTASNGGGMASNILTTDKRGWSFPTEEKYNALKVLGICSKPYEEIRKQHEEFMAKYQSTFNLWEGNKYKSNILKYRKDYDGYHPTQKPVLLLEDLVKTFSNEGDTVVDLTMGSGSTGVACKNTGRNFVGIEMDDEYFGIAKERLETHETQLTLI